MHKTSGPLYGTESYELPAGDVRNRSKRLAGTHSINVSTATTLRAIRKKHGEQELLEEFYPLRTNNRSESKRFEDFSSGFVSFRTLENREVARV